MLRELPKLAERSAQPMGSIRRLKKYASARLVVVETLARLFRAVTAFAAW
jgi:hypothetical protein